VKCMKKSWIILIVLGLALLAVSPAAAVTTAPVLNRIEIYDNNILVGYCDMLCTQTWPNPIPVTKGDVIKIKVQSTGGNSCSATLTIKDPTGKVWTFIVPKNSKVWNEATCTVNWASGSKSFDTSIKDCTNSGQVFSGDKSFKIQPPVISSISPTSGTHGAQVVLKIKGIPNTGPSYVCYNAYSYTIVNPNEIRASFSLPSDFRGYLDVNISKNGIPYKSPTQFKIT
jgi:hypothetical protein